MAINPTAHNEECFTKAQQTLARQNIGAASVEEVKELLNYIVSVFEELKELIESSNPDGAIAVLDKAILDVSVLA